MVLSKHAIQYGQCSGFPYYHLTTHNERASLSATWNLKINLDTNFNFTDVFQKSMPVQIYINKKKKDTKVFEVLIEPVTISYLYLRKD
jgi:hypothetical protein